MRRSSLVLAVLAIFGCGTEPAGEPSPEPVVEPLAPPPDGDGFQVTMSAVAEAGAELWACHVYQLPNAEWANVNRVETRNNDGLHHVTLSTLSLTGASPLEAGTYDCAELYGNTSLMQGQVMIYGNQGSAEHTLQLPEGVAATLPPGLQVIHEVHYVNATDAPVTVTSYVNAWTIPQSEFVTGVWGGTVRDENIEIPAGSTHTEWSRCVMNHDVEVLFLASHTHQLGVDFTIAPFDGTDADSVIYENTDWHTPRIQQFDPPLVVPAGTGFEWSCTWRNPGTEPVRYGLESTDEMCNLVLVHTPMDLGARCEVVASSDGVLWDPDAD